MVRAIHHLQMAKKFAQKLIDTGDVDVAERLLQMRNQLCGLTYNNFGCVEKQSVNLVEALKYSKIALEYESQLEDKGDLTSVNNSAGTILNICAILSKLERHDQAY